MNSSTMNDKKTKSVDVSVVIVNWNTKDLLLKCIRTIYDDQAGIEIEIIVVDNGSTDGSAEAVRENYPEVNVISNGKNLGFAKANNIGIKTAKGKYICLSNSDIEVERNCFSGLIDYMERDPSAGVVGPTTLNADRSLRKNCKTFPTLWNTFCRAFGLNKVFKRSAFFADVLMLHFDHRSIREVDVLPGCFLMIRKDAMDAVGLLDENYFIYGEDKDWCRRFKQAGWKVVFYPESKVIHLAGQSAASAPVRFLIERIKANEYYWLKYHGKLLLRMYMSILILHHLVRVVGNVATLKVFTEKNRLAVFGHIACLKWILLRLVLNRHITLSELPPPY